jgi:hypothetical protein
VIIIDEMGINFGSNKKDPIVIEEDEIKVDEEITVLSDGEGVQSPKSEENDDLSFINQFKKTKAEKNTKLFEKLVKDNKQPREKARKSPSLDTDFAAEIRRAKEKKETEKLAKEAEEKCKREKLRKNAELFEKMAKKSSSSSSRKSSSRTEVRTDFLEEMRRKADLNKKTKNTISKDRDPPKSKPSESGMISNITQ